MASKGKPSPRRAVEPLSNEQLAKLEREHKLVDPTRPYPTGRPRPNYKEIDAQNPKTAQRLLNGCCRVIRGSCKVKAWGLENVPATGQFITAATHVTQFDVFIPMCALFQMGRRPRYMAKAEMASWPVIGKWFQAVGMQPVPRRSGKARQIEEESIKILTSGRPLTIWPEGTVTRDPQKWPMSMKNGVGFIALESSRRIGRQIPLFCAVTWGAASINHFFPWPRKNVVLYYDSQLDYSDLLKDMDSWGDDPPVALADELARRIRVRMKEMMAEIRGIPAPAGFFDYRLMEEVPEPAPFTDFETIDAEARARDEQSKSSETKSTGTPQTVEVNRALASPTVSAKETEEESANTTPGAFALSPDKRKS